LRTDIPLLSNDSFKVGESATVGNGAFGKGWSSGDVSGSSGSSGDSSGSSGSGTSGSGNSSGGSSGNSSESADDTTQSGTGDENGVCYNMEVYKFYRLRIDYLDNAYISEDITQDDLEQLISYCSKGSVNYWSPTHNCAEVACKAWNLVCDTQVDPYRLEFVVGTIATPKGLWMNMKKLPNYAENYSLKDALKQ
ncbi:MAG: hypothetical protein K2K10_03370, partial [Acetatifactor sp.]|nr:hypothetical protein [Acetatifactor sp.]